MAKRCEMVIGYLLPRKCGAKARSVCIKCGRAMCDEHTVITDAGLVCEACYSGLEHLAIVPPGETPAFTAEDFALFSKEPVTEEEVFAEMS